MREHQASLDPLNGRAAAAVSSVGVVWVVGRSSGEGRRRLRGMCSCDTKAVAENVGMVLVGCWKVLGSASVRCRAHGRVCSARLRARKAHHGGSVARRQRRDESLPSPFLVSRRGICARRAFLVLGFCVFTARRSGGWFVRPWCCGYTASLPSRDGTAGVVPPVHGHRHRRALAGCGELERRCFDAE